MSGSYRTCGCAVVAVLLCVCFSCRIEVPVMELANAKIAVEKARKADAENFAHDEYRKAAEYLLQAHTLVFKEKDYDELMKAISLSEEYAKKAYTLALSRSLAHWKTRAESWIAQSEQACVRNISGAAYGEAEKYLEQIKKTGNQYPEQHVQYYRKICTSLEPFINTIPVLKKEILNRHDTLLKMRVNMGIVVVSGPDSGDGEKKSLVDMENKTIICINEGALCDASVYIRLRADVLYAMKKKSENAVVKKNLALAMGSLSETKNYIQTCKKLLSTIDNKDAGERIRQAEKRYTESSEVYSLAVGEYDRGMLHNSMQHVRYCIGENQVTLSLLKSVSNSIHVAASGVKAPDRMTGNDIPGSVRVLTVYYESDKIDISLKEKRRLKSFLQHCNLDKVHRVLLESHADRNGSWRYNFRLSRQRAAWMVKYLKAQGFAGEEIHYNFYGEAKPLYTDWRKEYLNRRIQIIVSEGE